MKPRLVVATAFMVFVFGAAPAFSQPRAAESAATAAAFKHAWAAIFGEACPADGGDSPGATPETTFEKMWDACQASLPPDGQEGARDALRVMALGDGAPVKDALTRTVASGRLIPGDHEAVLWYAFLMEEAADASILPQALPPGKNGARVKEAVAGRGGDWPSFLNRMAAWVAERAVVSGALRMEASSLPAVWVVDHDLPPGGFTAWRLSVPFWASSVRGEALGGIGSEKLRIISVFAGKGGASPTSGVGSLAHSSILLPRGGDSLWLLLWNPSNEGPAGFGVTVTLWSDLNPPFQVKEARLAGGVCDLLLSETPGLAGYLFKAAGPDSGFSPAAPPFVSEGPGLNRYRLLLTQPAVAGSRFELQAFTASGGQSSAPLEVDREIPR